MAVIHPTAIVAAGARLADDVEIGPYSIIGEHVSIGARTVVGPHVVIEGHTSIGEDNRFFQFSSIGAQPQDKKWNGEPTRLEIGHRNTIREFCTFNTGTAQDQGVTRLGADNWMSAYVLVGMYTSLTQDVPPFVLVNGNPAAARGVNIEGIKRRGFTRPQIDAIRAAYKTIYRSGLTLEEAKAALQEAELDDVDNAAPVRVLREFLGVASRGIVR